MKTIKLTFSGDIMLNNEIRESYKMKEDSYNFDSIFEDIKEFLLESDYVIGNLETPITDNNSELKKLIYQFTSPLEFAKAVKDAGFDFVSTANNHCLDNGIEGIKKTAELLDSIGLKHTGTFYQNRDLSIVDVKGIKIGILAYTYGTNAFENNIYLKEEELIQKVNMIQDQEVRNYFFRKLYKSKNMFFRILRKIFGKLRLFQMQKPAFERYEKSFLYKKLIAKDIIDMKNNNVDYIIVCLHEGGQYNEKPIQRAIENFKFIQNCNVDLIIGNHEHVIQPIEKKNDKITTYCLGNFSGIAGILTKPYDKMAEYSILFHTYLNKDKEVYCAKNTFTIIKNVLDKDINKGVKIELLYNLIKDCKDEEEKKKLMIDNQKIVKIFSNKDIKIDNIQKEYEI